MAKKKNDDEPKPTMDFNPTTLRLGDATAGKVAVTDEVRISKDGRYADEAMQAARLTQAAQRVLDQCEEGTEAYEAANAEFEKAGEEWEAAKELAKEHSVLFRARALGGRDLEDLMDAHLPTPAQNRAHQDKLKKQGIPAGERLQWNPETFPAAIISASLVHPLATVEEAQAFWDDPEWSRGETNRVLDLCYGVNQIVK